MASCVPIKTPADVVVVLMMLRRINKPKLQNKPIKVDQPHRRLVQLIITDEDEQQTNAMMDMLLAKKRSEDRRNWLQEKGDMADIEA
jgi:hypothetical protein